MGWQRVEYAFFFLFGAIRRANSRETAYPSMWRYWADICPVRGLHGSYEPTTDYFGEGSSMWSMKNVSSGAVVETNLRPSWSFNASTKVGPFASGLKFGFANP